MNLWRHRFPAYGTIGLIVLLVMMLVLVAAHVPGWESVPWTVITAWTTPVCWWCYICALDAWLYRRRGNSLLRNQPQQLLAQCLVSIACWCMFEAYNRLMPGWRYLNLDPNLAIRFAGYAVAFATIFPGIFLTTAAIQELRLFAGARCKPIRWSDRALAWSQVLGGLFCFAPPLLPAHWRGYLWAAVWIGWVLLLEPVNYRRGMPSLYRDWETGNWARTLQLAAAGAICGLLWEFWNYWAYTKWVYVFPLPDWLRLYYFEMPLIGFLGFLPFALECFVLFHFVSGLFSRQDHLGL